MKSYLILLICSFISFSSFSMENFESYNTDKDLKKKIIQKLIYKLGGGKLTEEMSEIMAEKPMSVYYLKKSNDDAEKLSRSICQVNERRTNDEVDAVRHFLGSAMLSAYYGQYFARELLTAHENRGPQNRENIMDLRNNEIGVLFSTQLRTISIPWRYGLEAKKILFSKLSWKVKALKLINNGELNVIESKKSACMNSNFYPNM